MRCAVYCRVSSDQQREAHTIESQRQRLLEHVQSMGWETVAVEEDNGVSGEVEPWARPAMSRVLEMVRSQAVDVVLVIDIDRVTRDGDNIAFGIVRKELREHGVKLATPRGVLDFDSPEQRLQQDILSALASYERHKILERTLRGRKNAVLRGERTLAKPPLGWRWDEEQHTFVIDEREAEVVRTVFALVAEGHNCTSTERELRLRGLKGRPEGDQPPKFLVRTTVRAILQRESYYTGQWAAQPKWDPSFVVAMPPIVDDETWHTANRMWTRRRTPARRHVHAQYLLRGIGRCSGCGAPIRCHTMTDGREYYRCEYRTRAKANGEACSNKKALRGQAVDTAVWSYVRSIIQDPAALRAEVARLFAAEAPAGEDTSAVRQSIESELGALAEERARLVRLVRKGVLSEAELETELADIERQRRPLLNRLELLAIHEGRDQRQQEAIAAIEATLVRMQGVVDALTFDERASLVREIVDEVVVDGVERRVEIRSLLFVKDPDRVRLGKTDGDGLSGRYANGSSPW